MSPRQRRGLAIHVSGRGGGGDGKRRYIVQGVLVGRWAVEAVGALGLFIYTALLLLSTYISFRRRNPSMSNVSANTCLATMGVASTGKGSIIIDAGVPMLVASTGGRRRLGSPSGARVLIAMGPRTSIAGLGLINALSGASSTTAVDPGVKMLTSFDGPHACAIASCGGGGVMTCSIQIVGKRWP